MGIHGWLLLDSKAGQHLLSDCYTPAFGLPFSAGAQSPNFGMSLAALVFALKQNADEVLPKKEAPVTDAATQDKAAEYQQLAQDPAWVDTTPNASSIRYHNAGSVTMTFFEHTWFNVLCVLVLDPSLCKPTGCYMAEILCKKFIKIHSQKLVGLTSGAMHNLWKAFRPAYHAVLHTVARRCCCARFLQTLGYLYQSLWMFITYSPELTAHIAEQEPLRLMAPRKPGKPALHKGRKAGAAAPVSCRSIEEHLLEQCSKLRGCAMLYFQNEVEGDLGSSHQPLHRAAEGVTSGIPVAEVPAQDSILKQFHHLEPDMNIALLLDTIVAVNWLQRSCCQAAQQECTTAVMEYHMDGPEVRVQIKIVQQEHLYVVFPVYSSVCGAATSLVTQLISEDLTNARHILSLLHAQEANSAAKKAK
jgi:hypothetical protein